MPILIFEPETLGDFEVVRAQGSVSVLWRVAYCTAHELNYFVDVSLEENTRGDMEFSFAVISVQREQTKKIIL